MNVSFTKVLFDLKKYFFRYKSVPFQNFIFAHHWCRLLFKENNMQREKKKQKKKIKNADLNNKNPLKFH